MTSRRVAGKIAPKLRISGGPSNLRCLNLLRFGFCLAHSSDQSELPHLESPSAGLGSKPYSRDLALAILSLSLGFRSLVGGKKFGNTVDLL
jgi:hypothetical protein